MNYIYLVAVKLGLVAIRLYVGEVNLTTKREAIRFYSGRKQGQMTRDECVKLAATWREEFKDALSWCEPMAFDPLTGKEVWSETESMIGDLTALEEAEAHYAKEDQRPAQDQLDAMVQQAKDRSEYMGFQSKFCADYTEDNSL